MGRSARWALIGFLAPIVVAMGGILVAVLAEGSSSSDGYGHTLGPVGAAVIGGLAGLAAAVPCAIVGFVLSRIIGPASEARDRAMLGRIEGHRRFQVGDPEGAISAFTDAIALDPSYALAYRDRADAYRRLGREREAAADREQAESIEQAERTPTSEALRARGEMCLSESSDPSTQEANRARNRRDALARNAEGLRLLQAGDSRGALAAFEEGIALEPPLVVANRLYSNRAEATRRLGTEPEVEEDTRGPAMKKPWLAALLYLVVGTAPSADP